MDQDLDGQPADGVEGAEDVEGWRGAETEDGLPFVQDYESLEENHRKTFVKSTLYLQIHFMKTKKSHKTVRKKVIFLVNL